MKREVVVALATDNNYLLQTYLVIQSAMKVSNCKFIYFFYILVEKSVDVKQNELRKIICTQYSNCCIEYIIVGDIYNKVPMNIDHITRPTYYRLLLPQLLNYEKCIYLDSDIIVCEDLAKLNEIDLNGYEVAGVKAYSYHIMSKEDKKIYIEKVKLPTINQYINAGMLLMNLKFMRENGFCEKTEKIVNYNFPTQDQDIINKVCYGKIKILPYKYNVQVSIFEESDSSIFEEVFDVQEIEEAKKFPIILHYSKPYKPWEYFDIPYATIWWNICKASFFYDTFYNKFQDSFFYYGVIRQQKLWKCDIWSENWYAELKNYRDIYVYGAGQIGKKVIQILLKNKIQITGILVSKLEQKEEIVIDNVKVEEFSEKINKEALFIVSVSVPYQMQIRRNLFAHNIFQIVMIDRIDEEL